MLRIITIVFIGMMILSCSTPTKLIQYPFPKPVDTSSRPIEYQEKKEYYLPEVGVYADNLFDGARMNGFEYVDDQTVRVLISAENRPINSSAYYAFRIWSKTAKTMNVQIKYLEDEHRYWPKMSLDGKQWIRIDPSRFDTTENGTLANLKVNLSPEKWWIAGQEIHDSNEAREWVVDLMQNPSISHSVIGKSKLGRDLHMVDMCVGSKKGKDAIVIISRQHPPEVTGYLAMKHFVERIMEDNVISRNFRKKFRILIMPCMNPDGVDLGHWRHSAGGIDLNRDWSNFNQEETRQVAEYLIHTIAENDNKVLLGLDFHSTQHDIYYTLQDSLHSNIYPFKDYWIQGIDNALDPYVPHDDPSGLGQPISKGWFYVQFGAEGITYEIGDESPRAFIKEKATVAADEMMKLLLLK